MTKQELLISKANQLKHINASKIDSFQLVQKQAAATKIQAIYRGYRIRKQSLKTCTKLPMDQPIEEPKEINYSHYVQLIQQRAESQSKIYSKSYIVERCRKLDDLYTNRKPACKYQHSKLYERAEMWLTACKNLEGDEPKRTVDDVPANQEMRDLHKMHLAAAREWWKEDLEKLLDGKEDMDAWIQTMNVTID
ncbi:hypothetical protein HDV02_000561 [Globomyces sp. JEL0801]|nr:hypothetical protein HDV02_000561 [Globomyces sp. JEL0801]